MVKKMTKKVLALTLTVMLAVLVLVTGAPIASADSATNVGLAAHALKAYREGWIYVWGGTSYGVVDCSGLIYTYHGVGGNRVDMLSCASEWGYVSNGIPNIHGLGLHHPGHVGVYVGSGVAIDARDEQSGVVYHNVYNKNWAEWFKVAGVSYPTNGWVLLDGQSYYYENGQYIVSTSRTLDGVTYYFDAAGVSNIAPPSSAYQATDYSTANADPAPTPDVSEESSKQPEVVKVTSITLDQSSLSFTEGDYGYELNAYAYPENAANRTIIWSSSNSSVATVNSWGYVTPLSAGKTNITAKTQDGGFSKTCVVTVKAKEVSKPAPAPEPSKVEEESSKQTSETVVQESSEQSGEASKSEESKTENKKSETKKNENKKTETKKTEEEKVEIIAEYEYEDDEKSKTVSSIQTRLYELGYLTAKATGYYGGDTVDAVMMFQNKNELDVTGIVDSKTYKVLKSSKVVSNFSLLEQGSYDDGNSVPVAALQTRLTELKYYYDEITGFYGELTANAVKQFQKNNDLDATGSADPETQLRIFSKDAQENPNAGSVMYGDNGALVVKLQKRLVELRYLSGVVSENFDDTVLDAVHAYQEAAGLKKADGLTAKQLKVLYSDKAVKSPEYNVLKYGFSGDDVAQLQSRLASLRYYDGKTSGVYSKAVVSAVENFQKDYDLEVTGYADEATQEAIKTEAQKESTHVGEQLIVQTATISDNALAGVAGGKSIEVPVTSNEEVDFTKTLIVLGAVLAVVLVITAIFVVGLKKKTASAKRRYK